MSSNEKERNSHSRGHGPMRVSEEAVYEFVEEDSELEAVGKVFSELMDDDVELK